MPARDEIEQRIRARIEASVEVKRALLGDEHVAFVRDAAALVADALRAGGKVLLCGNGGSAADATHIAGELVGRFLLDRRPLPAIALGDSVSALTAIANDFGYDEVFARQVRALGAPGDVLIALSTSGASANVLAAVAAARERGLRTIGMSGADRSALAGAVDLCLRAPASDTARVQEAHMLVGHLLCELVEAELAG